MKLLQEYSQSLLPDLSSFSKGWPSSSVRALRDNTGFLLRHARCPPLNLAKAVSFSICLRPRGIRDLRFAFRKSFTSNVRNDLAKSLEINTFKRRRIEAIFNGVPCLTTSHECPKMSISTGTQRQ